MGNTKFSEFTAGGDVQISDITVGLRGGVNTQFDFPGTGIKDVNGNYIVKWTSGSAAAVNWLEFINSDTANPVQIISDGADASVDIEIAPKNLGEINLLTDIVTVGQDIQHEGDADNKIVFGTDTQDYQTGGSSRIDVSDSGVRFGGANSRVTTILDEDNMASDSDTALATQQSIKAYVDSLAASSGFSKAARVASTIDYASTYANGASGVGATLTATGNGAASIDGVALSVNDLVLFKDQSNAFENGIYYLSTNGTAGTPSIFTRIDYFDETAEITYGEIVGVVEGTANLQTVWQLTSTVTTVGTDALNFQFMIISAPTSSTDDALVKYDGTSGKVIQNSVGILTDAGALSGLTQLDVDNIRIDGNTISSTDANGNVDIDLNGAGEFTINTGAVGITEILDEDNMASDSDTALATQQSIKAYVDSSPGSAIPTIGSSTDDAIVRWDGATGDAVANSVAILTDAGALSGLTQVDVDNIRVDGNTISSTDAGGNIIVTPDTTGDLVLDGVNWPQAGGGTGTILRMSGAGQSAWTTSTFADTYAVSTILFASSTNAVSSLATANSAVLTTSATGAPAWSSSMTNGQLLIGSTGATPATTTITAGAGISITNGAGSITISGGGGGFSWTEVTGTSQAMAVNNGYIANNAGLVTLTLPATAAIGDSLSIVGKGAGLWAIAQNASQVIHYLSQNTTTGVTGTVTATQQYDSIELICITANTDWVVVDAVGTVVIA